MTSTNYSKNYHDTQDQNSIFQSLEPVYLILRSIHYFLIYRYLKLIRKNRRLSRFYASPHQLSPIKKQNSDTVNKVMLLST